MKIIVCLDERKGMMFNQRRQSRDRALIDNVEAMLDGERLYIAPYSEPLFENNGIKLRVKTDPLRAAKDNWCFIENMSVASYKDKIEELVIYHWNRHYPCDFYFDMELDGFTLTHTEEFVGSSHEKITKEVWKK